MFGVGFCCWQARKALLLGRVALGALLGIHLSALGVKGEGQAALQVGGLRVGIALYTLDDGRHIR